MLKVEADIPKRRIPPTTERSEKVNHTTFDPAAYVIMYAGELTYEEICPIGGGNKRPGLKKDSAATGNDVIVGPSLAESSPHTGIPNEPSPGRKFPFHFPSATLFQ